MTLCGRSYSPKRTGSVATGISLKGRFDICCPLEPSRCDFATVPADDPRGGSSVNPILSWWCHAQAMQPQGSFTPARADAIVPKTFECKAVHRSRWSGMSGLDASCRERLPLHMSEIRLQPASALECDGERATCPRQGTHCPSPPSPPILMASLQSPPARSPSCRNAPGGRPSKRWKDRRIRSALPKPQSSAMRCSEGWPLCSAVRAACTG
jgi:hypothetical protein